MKFKWGTTFCLVILFFAVALVVLQKQAEDLHLQNTESLLELSNRLNNAGVALDDLRRGNLVLTNGLATLSQRFEAASNNFLETSGQLARVKSEFGNQQGHVTDLNRQVGDLLPRNQELGEHAVSLSNNFVLRNDQLAVLQQQLAVCWSNNVFLAAKLQDVMAQKSEWQRRFNDFDEVRNQFNYLAYGFY